MSKVSITFFSSTGNTEEIANIIRDNINDDLYFSDIENIDTDIFFESDKYILGSHADGEEEIDTLYMEPFINENSRKFYGKEIFLFGSYGWGDGLFMDKWKENMESLGANVIDTFAVEETPDSEQIDILIKKINDFL